MPYRSIYVKRDTAITGNSPQAVYEKLWYGERRRRLIIRGVITLVALILGAVAVSARFGVALALLAALADVTYRWWQHTVVAGVWRTGQRGDRRTGWVLRLSVGLRGHRIITGRAIPDYGRLDYLVIGPGGVWLVGNKAVAPDTDITHHEGRLFINQRPAAKAVADLAAAADTVARLLSQELNTKVEVTPLLAIHGGRMRRGGGFTADGVTLLRASMIPLWVHRHPTAHRTPSQVGDLAQAAARVLPIANRIISR